MPPSTDELREALALHAAGVSVVAAADGGVYRGLTATSLVTVAVDPPLLLVSLDSLAATTEAVRRSGGFTVSLLARDQEFLAERFSGTAPPAPPAWEGIRHRVLESGRPVLEGALAWFECEVAADREVADHALLVGSVHGAWRGSGDPLIWWDRRAWTVG